MPLQSLLPSLKARPLTQASQTGQFVSLIDLVHSNFSLSTWLLLGACLQTIAFLTIQNKYYTMLPAAILLVMRIANATLIHFGIKPNPFLEKAFLKKRVTAVIPDGEGNLIAPGSERIAIILLGAKSNHPFGVLSPDFLATFKLLAEMNASFDRADGPNGFLGQTNWQRKDERGAMEFVFLSYWRSIDCIHAFAHGEMHRAAWQWWEKTIKQHDCVGINHEVYEAEPGHWENMYANFQPTGMGATTYLRQDGGKLDGGSVAEEWISPLIDASKGRFKASSARMGVDATRFDAHRPDGDVYG